MTFKVKTLDAGRRRPVRFAMASTPGLMALAPGVSPSMLQSGAIVSFTVGPLGRRSGGRQNMFAGALELPDAVRAQPNAARNTFHELLRDLAKGRDSVQIIRLGLPAAVLKDTAAYFEVSLQRVRGIARLPETTAHTLIKRGALLDPASSERIWRLADIALMATEVFENESDAKIWLRAPNRTFPEGAPIDYLDTEPGAAMVRQVLNAIATGGAA